MPLRSDRHEMAKRGPDTHVLGRERRGAFDGCAVAGFGGVQVVVGEGGSTGARVAEPMTRLLGSGLGRVGEGCLAGAAESLRARSTPRRGEGKA